MATPDGFFGEFGYVHGASSKGRISCLKQSRAACALFQLKSNRTICPESQLATSYMPHCSTYFPHGEPYLQLCRATHFFCNPAFLVPSLGLA